MTKYEWERELKKNLSHLPSDEVAKVLDYYDELFEDKSESGKSEAYIIREFGNPFDVARRIMNEFETENGRGGAEDVDNTSSPRYDNAYRGGYSQDEIDGMPFFKAVKINLKNTLNKVKRKLVNAAAEKPQDEPENEPAAKSKEVTPWDNAPAKEFDEGYTYKRDGIRASRDYDSSDRDSEREKLNLMRAQIEKERQELENQKKQVIKKTRGGCARVAAKLIFFIPFMIFAIVCWSVAVSLFATGIGCAGGGVFFAVAPLFGLGGIFLVNLGGGLVCSGIGIVLTVVSVKLIKVFGIITLRYFGGGKKKIEAAEQN